MQDVDYFIGLLLEHFGVSTISQLAEKIGVTQQTISSWRSRQAISAIQKKCRELGIYTEIFGHNQNFQNNYGNNAQTVHGDQASGAGGNIDAATMALILEAYQTAEKEGRIKEFRFHIMEFTEG